MAVLHGLIFNNINYFHFRCKLEDFKEGDLAAVFGGDLTRDSRTADAVSFCKVSIVGQEDLVVQNTVYYSNTYHVVPKSICRKIHLDPKVLSSAETLIPKIGDLVVSFSRGDGDEVNKKTGILCKIMYRLGQPDRCEILCGTENVNVGWNSLIVLRKDS